MATKVCVHKQDLKAVSYVHMSDDVTTEVAWSKHTILSSLPSSIPTMVLYGEPKNSKKTSTNKFYYLDVIEHSQEVHEEQSYISNIRYFAINTIKMTMKRKYFFKISQVKNPSPIVQKLLQDLNSKEFLAFPTTITLSSSSRVANFTQPSQQSPSQIASPLGLNLRVASYIPLASTLTAITSSTRGLWLKLNEEGFEAVKRLRIMATTFIRLEYKK
ncbi:hypothetical protein SELMODRAFT_418989 [Selaginella moellendorffii]|uniref:Uncharacterized protein n=1 Tax=Selaginella moellendorffii TaxID=88036 RepID=D8S7G3_SELML|nr:hypothetical protein SELMODRAFT_418989 [Selaginella moellendorffii]